MPQRPYRLSQPPRTSGLAFVPLLGLVLLADSHTHEMGKLTLKRAVVIDATDIHPGMLQDHDAL